MKIRVKCPACGHKQRLTAAGTPPETTCSRCGKKRSLTWSESVAADREVDTCPVCQGQDFYVHKDLNRNLGLTAVVIVALVSVVFLYYDWVKLAYGVLFVFALVDLVIYQLLTFVTVCYRCQTELRGSYRRTAPFFDLHTAEKLELEYSRRLDR
jgi:DNA-directed RNA polymerase subunit RPC12/RpoP